MKDDTILSCMNYSVTGDECRDSIRSCALMHVIKPAAIAKKGAEGSQRALLSQGSCLYELLLMSAAPTHSLLRGSSNEAHMYKRLAELRRQ